jgi:hydrogenase maturation protein HypF
MAFACLFSEYGAEYPGIGQLLSGLSENERVTMRNMIERNINSPGTSSAGRLFDIVAALTGFRGKVEYGAQAAIELERTAAADAEGRYSHEISNDVLSFAPMFEEIRRDIEKNVAKPLIAFKFHHAFAAGAADMCERIRNETGIENVALSGGVFNNGLLTRLMVQALKKKSFNAFVHAKTPPGDANIALGQAVVACHSEDLCV